VTLMPALQEVDLFAGLDAEVVEAIAAATERRHIEPGELLFREGDAGEFFFVVEQGQLEVIKRSSGGADVVLRRMGPREVGGMTSMAVAKRRSATLRARDEVAVLTIARERFLELLADHPALVRAVIGTLSAKVRGKTYQLASLLEGRAGDALPRVAVFDSKPYDRAFLAQSAEARLSLHFFDVRLGPDTARLASGFDAVCAFVNDDLGADTLEQLAAEGVQLVAMRCSGVNNVDLEAAARLHLSVVRVPAYSPHAVAEHTVALLLALNRRVHRAYNRVREGNFRLDGLVGIDLHGRTAGLVGLGAIGGCLSRILSHGFGMKVLAADPFADEQMAADVGAELVDRDRVLAEADVLSLHAPLTPQTHHLLDADAMAAMRPGALIINTSRGGLIDTGALIDALKSGHIGGAGLDVYEEEGGTFFEDRSGQVLTDDVLARLLTFPNVIITSHQAFLTADALETIANTTVDNIVAFLGGARGRELPNVVSAAR
jgi:D-lactate dehydrogenase